jgi:hypothetical protein
MRFVSPVLKRVVYPTLSGVGSLHRFAWRGQRSVVTYHGVLPADYKVMNPQLDGSLVRPEGFRCQLRCCVRVTKICADASAARNRLPPHDATRRRTDAG